MVFFSLNELVMNYDAHYFQYNLLNIYPDDFVTFWP